MCFIKQVLYESNVIDYLKQPARYQLVSILLTQRYHSIWQQFQPGDRGQSGGRDDDMMTEGRTSGYPWLCPHLSSDDPSCTHSPPSLAQSWTFGDWNWIPNNLGIERVWPFTNMERCRETRLEYERGPTSLALRGFNPDLLMVRDAGRDGWRMI